LWRHKKFEGAITWIPELCRINLPKI
jgi:hypothetical protein